MARIYDESGKSYEYKVIVIEGADGSGKSTLAKALKIRLDNMSIPNILQHFPNKQQQAPTPELDRTLAVTTPVAQYLHNQTDFGINPHAVAHIYTMDRLMTWYGQYYYDPGISLKNRVLGMCEEHYASHPGVFYTPVLIFDRYTQSSVVYQSVDQLQDNWDDFRKNLENYEYEILKLPRPDKVIYLDAPIEGIVKSLEQRGEEPDKHESDLQFLSDVCVAGRYHALYGNWDVYEAMNKNGVHNDIQEHVLSDLGYGLSSPFED